MKQKQSIRQHIESESVVRGGRELRLTYRLGDGDVVPAILQLPADTPAPAALLLHGYSSHKEDMARSVGSALLEHGIASLGIDLPLHGTRADPLQAQSARNPLAMMQLWRQGLADAQLGLHYLAARPECDARRIAIVGYSMGSFLAVALAADQPLVRAVVLAAGGDLPRGTAFAGIARMVADPVASVRRLNGRPLLMVHGRRDRTVLPEQAQRLFDAAAEPKELRWWDAGHYLPHAASAAAALWLRERLI